MITFSSRFAALRLFAVIVCLALISGVSTVTAQDEQTLVSSSADYIYGQSMNFNLSAGDLGDVKDVILFFRLGTSSDTYSVNIPVSPGSPIEIVYPLDLSQIRLLPFVSITYWWQINREFGSPIRVPEQVVSYVDDQFVWRQTVINDDQGGGSIRIHWTGDDTLLGEQAREVVLKMLPEIGRLIPIQQVLPFDVYIYPSTNDLNAALRLAGRESDPGQSHPDLGVALVTVINEGTAEQELRGELARELTALLLYQAFGRQSYDLPPWLSHGIAGTVRDEQDVVQGNTIRSAISTDSTIPLMDLCNGIDIDNDLALAQSESLVNYLAKIYGESAVRDLVSAFAQGTDCQTAFAQIIQQTPEQIETAWLRTQGGSQSGRTVAETALWLILVLAGFGLAGLLLLLPWRRSR